MVSIEASISGTGHGFGTWCSLMVQPYYLGVNIKTRRSVGFDNDRGRGLPWTRSSLNIATGFHLKNTFDNETLCTWIGATISSVDRRCSRFKQELNSRDIASAQMLRQTRRKRINAWRINFRTPSRCSVVNFVFEKYFCKAARNSSYMVMDEK